MLQFDWNILWTIVNIVILVVAVRLFLWNPVQAIIAQRQKAITESLDKAQKAEEEADEAKARYEESIRNAHNEAGKIIDDARARAQHEYDIKIEMADKTSQQMIDDANKKIEEQKSRAVAGAQAEIAYIAISATEKLLQKNIDKETNTKLIESFLVKAGGNNDSE